jgi:hypothetical protein
LGVGSDDDVPRRLAGEAVAQGRDLQRGRRRLTSGISSEPEKRIGARTGGAIKTDAAIAPAQSSSPTTVTASGRCSGVVEGNTARATAAALAAGSEPPMRTVLFVAKLGNPSSSAACEAGSDPPSELPAGAWAGAGAGAAEVGSSSLPPLLPKTIAAAMKRKARTTRPPSSFGAGDFRPRGRGAFGGLGSFAGLGSGEAPGIGGGLGAGGCFCSPLAPGSFSSGAGTSALIGRFGVTG